MARCGCERARGSGLTLEPRPADAAGIAAALEALARGRLVLHPTETVVSLTGNPFDSRAVEAARGLKGYSAPRPFLCLVEDAASARALAREWPAAADRLAAAFWPGPLTLVVPAGESTPAAVTDRGTIAVRPAAEPVSAALLAAWRGPLFSTSANPRGEPPPEDVADAVRILRAPGADVIGAALEPVAPSNPRTRGDRAARLPSTIIDASVDPPRVLRPGALPLERIREIVPDVRAADEPSCDRSPGRPT